MPWMAALLIRGWVIEKRTKEKGKRYETESICMDPGIDPGADAGAGDRRGRRNGAARVIGTVRIAERGTDGSAERGTDRIAECVPNSSTYSIAECVPNSSTYSIADHAANGGSCHTGTD